MRSGQDAQRGLYRKFHVTRDDPNGKHANCFYFVLDVDHDQFAPDALETYANKCEKEFPKLAADLRGIIAMARIKVGKPDIVFREQNDFRVILERMITAEHPHNPPDQTIAGGNRYCGACGHNKLECKCGKSREYDTEIKDRVRAVDEQIARELKERKQ